MTALLAADPREVRLAALALQQAADDADTLVRQVRRAQPPCWTAPSRRDYTRQLTDLSARVDRIADTHEDAAEVLLGYLRALEEAQERARYARDLAAEGRRQLAELSAMPGPTPLGPHPAEVRLQAAAVTLAEAEDLEREAASRAAARLRELADRAPEQGWTSKTLRFLEDTGVTAVQNYRELPASAVRAVDTLWSALPLVNGQSEQDEAREVLREASQVWLGYLELAREVQEGRPGKAAGEVLGVGGLVGRVNRAFPDPNRIKTGGYGGFLNGIAEGVLTVDDFDDAWEQAYAAKPLQDRIAALRDVPLPGVEDLIAGTVDLAHQEAAGGHAIQKHVGKSSELLRERIRLESKPGKPPVHRSTYPDLATAEEVVRKALADSADLVRAFAEGNKASERLVAPLSAPVGTVMRPDGSMTSGAEVVVILRKTKDGKVFVYTSWLEPSADAAS